MIQLHNNEVKELTFRGCADGLKITAKVVNDTVNTDNTLVPSYDKCIIELYNGQTQIYSGDLKAFLQFMYFRSRSTSKKLNFLNAVIGIEVQPKAAAAPQIQIADLSFFDKPFYSEEFRLVVRMRDVFPSESDAGSTLTFDFDKSDEIGIEEFVIRTTPVQTSDSVKSLQINALTKCVLFAQDDVEFKAGLSGHAVLSCSCNDKNSNNLYSGEELAVMQAKDLNSNIDGDTIVTESIELTDREFLENPTFNLKLDTSKLSGHSTQIMWDEVIFNRPVAYQQINELQRLNPAHLVLLDLMKGLLK